MALIFDQAMQDLADEIRDSIPAGVQLQSKQNDASFLLELVEIYKNSERVVLNTLITELFNRTGKQWFSLLKKVDRSNSVVSQQENSASLIEDCAAQSANQKQVYRGQDISSSTQAKTTKERPKRKQYYRGSEV